MIQTEPTLPVNLDWQQTGTVRWVDIQTVAEHTLQGKERFCVNFATGESKWIKDCDRYRSGASRQITRIIVNDSKTAL